MITALIGRFENGIMKGAKQTRIIRERCHNGIKEIKVAKPKHGATILKHNPPSQNRIADYPKVMDALERRNIFISSGPCGDGMFAKRNFISGEILAYYSGQLWSPQDLFPSNQTLEERYINCLL